MHLEYFKLELNLGSLLSEGMYRLIATYSK